MYVKHEISKRNLYHTIRSKCKQRQRSINITYTVLSIPLTSISNYISIFIFAVPGPVTINSTFTESDKVTLKWNPPLLNPKCVHHYYVEVIGPTVRPSEIPIDTNSFDTNAIFVDLEPCGEYNYTIYPVLANKSRGMAFSNDFNTLEGSKYEIFKLINYYYILKEICTCLRNEIKTSVFFHLLQTRFHSQ